jgi:hypothetical protein
MFFKFNNFFSEVNKESSYSTKLFILNTINCIFFVGLNATKEPLNFLKIIGNSPQQQEADESDEEVDSDEETEEYAPINVVSKRKYTGNSQR